MRQIISTSKFWTFILLSMGLLSGRRAFAEEPSTATTTAKWDMTQPLKSLSINVSDLLTPAQREIVNSGFSTFTVFTVSGKLTENGTPSDKESEMSNSENDAHQEFRLACSVKLDTWEELYQIIRIDPAPVQTQVSQDYKTWSNECLHLSISNQDALNRMSNGGTLSGSLQIRQSTPDEGAKIKNWLVRQQSGFMQGLYAHMLGDFQFKGLIKIIIQVPPRPRSNTGIHSPDLPAKKGL